MLVISAFAPMVLAEEATTELEVESGITPDSIFYGLDNAMERIGLALTFDKAKRSEKALRNAEEKLAEIKAMAEAEKLQYAEEAQERHREMIDRAQKASSEIDSNGDKETAKETSEKLDKIQARMNKHLEKASTVRTGILERQRERMTEEQIAKLEEVFNNIDSKIEEAQSRCLQRQEIIRTRYKVLSGKTDSEVDEELGEMQEENLNLGSGTVTEKAKGPEASVDINQIKSS